MAALASTGRYLDGVWCCEWSRSPLRGGGGGAGFVISLEAAGVQDRARPQADPTLGIKTPRRRTHCPHVIGNIRRDLNGLWITSTRCTRRRVIPNEARSLPRLTRLPHFRPDPKRLSASAIAIGPVLQGLQKPVNDLSREALVRDIVNTVAITAIQAQDQSHG